MFVKFQQNWRGHKAGNIVECKTPAEIKGIQPQINTGVCYEYDPEKPDDEPKAKRKSRKKPKLTEDASKSSMTMGNMFGGDNE